MKRKLDKKRAFLVLLVTALTLSAFVGIASAAQTWHWWDDAYPGTTAKDGLTHKLDANMTRYSYGDDTKFVNLTNEEAAWWYAMQIVGGEEGLAFREKKWLAEIYFRVPEDRSGTIYIDVYSIKSDGTLGRKLANGSLPVSSTEGYINYDTIRCLDDPATTQIILPGYRLAVRAKYVGTGTLQLGYNGPTGEAGETPSRIIGPPLIVLQYMDIKPESCPNAFNPKRGGIMSVAVLGTEDFDVSTVDPRTIRLEGVIPLRWNYEDVATPFEGELCDCHDLRGDGYEDLGLKFKNQEIVGALDLDQVEAGAEIPLTLTGNLYDGTPFVGQDCIWINKAKK